jgi:hypothetical protein
MDWFDLVLDRNKRRALSNNLMKFSSYKMGEMS